MRLVFPTSVDDIDLAALDDPRPVPADRPWVLVDMVSSLDGAIAIDGRSGGLGNDADRAVFRHLRGVCDAVLVGASTVREENYGPVALDDTTRTTRATRGQHAWPSLVIVSGSLALDPTARVFTESLERGAPRPIVLTSSSSHARTTALDDVAEVLEFGDDDIDLSAAMRELRARGLQVLTCEGGPTLNGHLLAADLVDEWCWTIAPMLVGGDSARGVVGPEVPRRFTITRVGEADGALFVRAIRQR